MSKVTFFEDVQQAAQQLDDATWTLAGVLARLFVLAPDGRGVDFVDEDAPGMLSEAANIIARYRGSYSEGYLRQLARVYIRMGTLRGQYPRLSFTHLMECEPDYWADNPARRNAARDLLALANLERWTCAKLRSELRAVRERTAYDPDADGAPDSADVQIAAPGDELIRRIEGVLLRLPTGALRALYERIGNLLRAREGVTA